MPTDSIANVRNRLAMQGRVLEQLAEESSAIESFLASLDRLQHVAARCPVSEVACLVGALGIDRARVVNAAGRVRRMGGITRGAITRAKTYLESRGALSEA